MDRIWFGCLGFTIEKSQITSLDEWWLKFAEQITGTIDEKELIFTKMAFIMWHICKGRCEQIFQRVNLDPLIIAAKANNAVWSFIIKIKAEEQKQTLKRCVNGTLINGHPLLPRK